MMHVARIALAIIVNMSLLAACMMHVARIAPAIIVNMSLLAACTMHVARIIGSMHDACCKDCTGTPASQTMVGGRTTFQNSPA